LFLTLSVGVTLSVTLLVWFTDF